MCSLSIFFAAVFLYVFDLCSLCRKKFKSLPFFFLLLLVCFAPFLLSVFLFHSFSMKTMTIVPHGFSACSSSSCSSSSSLALPSFPSPRSVAASSSSQGMPFSESVICTSPVCVYVSSLFLQCCLRVSASLQLVVTCMHCLAFFFHSRKGRGNSDCTVNACELQFVTLVCPISQFYVYIQCVRCCFTVHVTFSVLCVFFLQ